MTEGSDPDDQRPGGSGATDLPDAEVVPEQHDLLPWEPSDDHESVSRFTSYDENLTPIEIPPPVRYLPPAFSPPPFAMPQYAEADYPTEQLTPPYAPAEVEVPSALDLSSHYPLPPSQPDVPNGDQRGVPVPFQSAPAAPPPAQRAAGGRSRRQRNARHSTQAQSAQVQNGQAQQAQTPSASTPEIVVPPPGATASVAAVAPATASAPAAAPVPAVAPVPAAPPRPEDLLVPSHDPALAAPATWGWRGKLHRLSGGLLKPAAQPREIAVREAVGRIQRGFSRPMTVVVVQPKGGAGKTPATICLSAAFGVNRGGYVVGWDDNETRGTLAVRVSNPDDQRATVWDLLSELGGFERMDARVGDLGFFVRAQPDAHFDALVSDDNPGNMAQIGEEEFSRLHAVLQRFYRVIVVDTGNNVRSPNWQAAVNAADQIVVVSTYQRDAGYSASWVLDHLTQTGRDELAANAITILTAADPVPDKAVRAQLTAHFAARTRAVCEIPYDPQLAHGGPIRWQSLSAPSRDAWTLAGATIVDALAEGDRRAFEARRDS